MKCSPDLAKDCPILAYPDAPHEQVEEMRPPTLLAPDSDIESDCSCGCCGANRNQQSKLYSWHIASQCTRSDTPIQELLSEKFVNFELRFGLTQRADQDFELDRVDWFCQASGSAVSISERRDVICVS